MTSIGIVLLSVAFAVIVLVGTTGNILVCLVVLLNRPMRTPMNYLLVNLAISDMMLLVFFSPTFVFKEAYEHPKGEAGHYLCLFITGETFAWMGGYTSAIFLLAIAIERYYAVEKPLRYGSSSISRHLKHLVTSCWLFSLAWNVCGFATKYYDEKVGACNNRWPTEHSFKVYAVLSFLTVGLIPSLTMVFLYSRVIYSLWFRRINVLSNHNEERRRIQRKKATKMVLSVSIIYAICWIPELTVFVLTAFAPNLIWSFAYPASVAMVSVNSAVNPLLYSFHSNHFRQHFKKLICCRCKTSSRISDASSARTREQ